MLGYFVTSGTFTSLWSQDSWPVLDGLGVNGLILSTCSIAGMQCMQSMLMMLDN